MQPGGALVSGKASISMTAVPLKLDGQRDCFGVACVPIPASGRIEDRSFTAMVLEAEVVVQITE